ncbi:MAG: hypothetical protein AAFP69_01780 [Planctomycetota bacterium]
MPASFLAEITDEQIADAIARVYRAEISYGRVSAEGFDFEAEQTAKGLSVADVREMLQHSIYGDSPEEEIRMAINIACEPADLPDGAAVTVFFEGE